VLLGAGFAASFLWNLASRWGWVHGLGSPGADASRWLAACGLVTLPLLWWMAQLARGARGWGWLAALALWSAAVTWAMAGWMHVPWNGSVMALQVALGWLGLVVAERATDGGWWAGRSLMVLDPEPLHEATETLRETRLSIGSSDAWFHEASWPVVPDWVVSAGGDNPEHVALQKRLDALGLGLCPMDPRGKLHRVVPPRPSWGDGVKRWVDLLLGGVMLVAALPLMAVIALAIRWVDGPGVVFWQRRVGRHGRVFWMAKFRSMRAHAEAERAALSPNSDVEGPVFKMRQDPRVTPLGAFLRRWSLDELPQLFQVLSGEMSLVGPRPALPEEVAQYPHALLERLQVAPGLTCIWQVSGRSEIGFETWMAMDLQYVRRRTLWLDLRLLARTLPAVLGGRGAW